MPLLIPPGMRAVSVQVDEVSDIAGFILPHAHVDILVAVSNQGGGQGDKPFSKIVLQNVEVLAVAQEVEKKKDEPELVKVVTVLVTPQDAERLALATREGVLHLAMRNYADTKIVLTSGTDVDELLASVQPQRRAGHAGAACRSGDHPGNIGRNPGSRSRSIAMARVPSRSPSCGKRSQIPAGIIRSRRLEILILLFPVMTTVPTKPRRAMLLQARTEAHPRTRRIRTVRRFLLRRLYQRMTRPLRPLWLRRARQSTSREARRGDDEVFNNENTSW